MSTILDRISGMSPEQIQAAIDTTHPECDNCLSNYTSRFAADNIAMGMVHPRYGKREFVNLVRWLLLGAPTSDDQLAKSFPPLEEVCGFEYVGTGYFRKKGAPKGEPAEILHAMQFADYLYQEMLKRFGVQQEHSTSSLASNPSSS